METLNFDIRGMTCGGCAVKVKHALGKFDGIRHAEVTLHPGTATVVVDSTRVTPAQIVSALTNIGFSATLRPTMHCARV